MREESNTSLPHAPAIEGPAYHMHPPSKDQPTTCTRQRRTKGVHRLQ